MAKKLVQIDVSSDLACPWCFVGKKNLEKAINMAKDQFDFEVLYIFGPKFVTDVNLNFQHFTLFSLSSYLIHDLFQLAGEMASIFS